MMEKIPWELGIMNCWQKQEYPFKTNKGFSGAMRYAVEVKAAVKGRAWI